jgi:hypothetical protein
VPTIDSLSLFCAIESREHDNQINNEGGTLGFALFQYEFARIRDTVPASPRGKHHEIAPGLKRHTFKSSIGSG